MSESWKPRRDDHLVEPMFAGLGVERSAQSAERARRSRSRAWVVVAVAIALVAARALWLWRSAGS